MKEDIKVTIASSEVLTNPNVIPYVRRLTDAEGLGADKELSGNGLTVFFMKQLDQGVLQYFLSLDATFDNYDFYCEIGKSKLDEPVPATFPNSGDKLLKDYAFGYRKIKGDKVLLKIDYCTMGANAKVDNSNLTHEFLSLFLGEYGNSDYSNIYTSKDSIAEIKATYEEIIL